MHFKGMNFTRYCHCPDYESMYILIANEAIYCSELSLNFEKSSYT